MHVSSAALEDRPDRADVKLGIGFYIAVSLFWLPVNMFWTVMLTNFLPGRVEELVGSAEKGTYLAYISAIGAVATTVIQLVVGPLSDACAAKWGRRRPFLFWGTFLGAACVMAFGLVGNFYLLMAAFFGLQLFINAATGPYQALIPDNVPPSRHGLASAYMGIALLVGQLAGAFSLIFLYKPLGMVNLLAIICALLVAGMVLTVTQVPDVPAPPEDRKPIGEALADLKDWQVKENPDFYGLLMSRSCINLAYSTVTSFLLYYLKDTIGPPEQGDHNLGIVLLLATVAGLVGTLIAGRFADRMSKKKIIYIACAILATTALLFAATSSLQIALVMAFVFGAGWGAFQAVDWAMACNLLPKGGAAKYMAIWHVCMTVPQVIAPMFGRIADPINARYGHGMGWRVAFISTVLYLIIGAILLRRVNERPNTPLEETEMGSDG